MMKIAGHIIIGVLSACLVCCTKTVSVEQEDSRIMFYGRSVFLQTGTKGIVPDENMTLPIYVTDDSETNPAFEATKIEYHLDNGLWYTDNPGWVSGKQYRLYAYILSQGNGQSVSVDIKDDLTKPGRKSGTHFTVSQPASYSADENAYADFLLSYPKNADGTDKPLVTLDFERTMACVELYMTRTQNNSKVIVDEITFSNVCTAAEYSLYFHGTGDRDGMKNVWQVTESNPVPYIFKGVNGTGTELSEKEGGVDRFDPSYRVMRFLVPDQSLGEQNKLTVKYRAWEKDESASVGAVTAEFNLSEYEPSRWSYGHRIRYYVSIDTGASIEGIVDQWKDVDYIEGTFLPD